MDKPKHHILKCWPPFFDDVGLRRKTFELRKNDRDFQVDDSVELREWNPETKEFTQRWIFFKICYVLRGSEIGMFPCKLLEPDACILGIQLPGNHVHPEKL